MIAVLTGDIINSRLQKSPDVYLSILRKELKKNGDSPKNWEIFRGDSFQAIIHNPLYALEITLRLKTALKRIKNLDARIAIGIGEMNYEASTISECNGTAFIFSGELYDDLKRYKSNLGIRTPFEDINYDINTAIKMAMVFMDNWSEKSSEIIYASLNNTEVSQKQIGKQLGIKQNTVSDRQSRAHLSEIKELISYYKYKLSNVLTR